ncbi:F-box/kelch-repeat protein At1g57790-like [Mercurialis annua]|uniref:F-box/kelch-repeat protein At1g57790-like n=1 Tax=Mercurialis annua TaxID=3986 RepID=UPI00215E21F7|nr:F-box/kelch-repeat protein At1g57790-like [Mercurialis annua]
MSWPDLSNDVSKLIYDKLHHRLDRIRFSFVCKRWNTIHRELNTRPFLMYYSSSSTDHHFTFRGPPLDRTFSRKIRVSADVIASKQGWLLIKDRENPLLYCCNPFTCNQINLPKFDPGVNPNAVFTAPPSSRDCVLFVVGSTDVGSEFVTINFIRCGDPYFSWKIFRVRNISDAVSCKGLAYHEGKLYCFFDSGKLGIWKLINNDWTVVASPLKPIPQTAARMTTTSRIMTMVRSLGIQYDYLPPGPFKEYHMMNCEGDILVLCTSKGFVPFSIFELDTKKMDWVNVTNLKHRAIFFNAGRNRCSSIAIRADKLSLRNKIFYFYEHVGSYIWIYDLETRSHRLSDSYPDKLEDLQVWIDPI